MRVSRGVEALRRGVEHPVVGFAVGIALITSAIAEVEDGFFGPVLAGDLGVHHGVFVLGVAHVLKALPDLVAGLERVFGKPPAG